MSMFKQIISSKGIIAAAVVALVMIGCDKNSDSTQEATVAKPKSAQVDAPAQTQSVAIAVLAGTNWQVEDVASGGIIDNSNLTLNFGDDGRLNGSSGCNSYMGGFLVSDDQLEVSNVAGTRMACELALMDLEQKFLSVLGAAASYSIDSERSKLTITAADGLTITAVLISQD